MKKVIVILLAFLMLLMLFACNNNAPANSSGVSASQSPSQTPSQEPSQPTNQPTSQTPNETPASTNTPDATAPTDIAQESWEPGYYNPAVDYTKNPRYKIVYMTDTMGALQQQGSVAYAAWAARANCDYSDFCSNGDDDLFLSTIELYAQQGVNGLILDPDTTIWSRVDELCNQLGLPYMPGMSEPADSDGNRLHPIAAFPNGQYGVEMANYVINYQRQNWPDANPGEIGMVSTTVSFIPPLNVRTVEAQKIWNQEFPGNEDHFFIADTAALGAGLDSDTGYNATSPIFAAHPEIKYWLVCASMDDYAEGAARALEQANKDQNAVISSGGGTTLINHWENGDESCWKSAIYTAQPLFCEGAFFGLYALMHGEATPETLWPEWIDHSTNQKYAYVLLPYFIIEKDTYIQYLAFIDKFTGMDTFGFANQWDGTVFPTRNTPPASYAG